MVAVIAAASGLGFGLSLIVAIGGQNAFVLRQGLRREYVTAIVAVCAASDLILITAGVAGLGALVRAVPAVLTGIRLAGAAFLAGYALLAARRAWRPGALRPAAPADGPGTAGTARTAGRADDGIGTAGAGGRVPAASAALASCLALTWLNPHVYLDTVVLLGSVAAGHGALRWWFGAGAGLASVVWFSALGYGARLLRPLFARPAAWRVLDAAIALTMLAIAANLLLDRR